MHALFSLRKRLCHLRFIFPSNIHLVHRNTTTDSVSKSGDNSNTTKKGLKMAEVDKLEVKETKGFFGGTKFENPWEKWSTPRFDKLLHWKFIETDLSAIPNQEDLDKILPLPDEQERTQTIERLRYPPADEIQVTWIGHSTLLVQFDSITILTDPVFREYCGPEIAQAFRMCYKRYRKAALQVRDIPHVDVVIVSHDHFDHLDSESVKQINRKFPEVKWFVGKNGRDLCGESKNIKDLLWWEEETTEIKGKTFTFACTPSQHWCRRTAFDQNKRLWCSWVIKGPSRSFFFAGDTGYYKPIFERTGQKYGPFSLAAIPIGTYEPRELLKYQHVNTEEAIKIHEDIQSKLSIGIHWGAFCMSNEFYLEPPRKLEKMMGKKKNEFISLKHGECWVVGTERARPAFMGTTPTSLEPSKPDHEA